MKAFKTAGVYRLTIGNFIYIGSSYDLKQRLCTHLCRLKKSKHPNPKLQNAYNKYGNFKSEILFTGHQSEILEVEQKELDLIWGHKYCANMQPVVNSPYGTKRKKESIEKAIKTRSGYRHSKETIEKLKKSHRARHASLSWGTQLKYMSAEEKQQIREKNKLKLSNLLKGKPRSEETRMKMSESAKGKAIPTSVRDKIRNSLIGYKHSDETKAKLSQLRKGKPLSQNNLESIRKTLAAKRFKVCLTIDGVDRIYDNIDIAAQSINVKRATLHAWLLGKNPWPVEQKQKKTKVKGLTTGRKID